MKHISTKLKSNIKRQLSIRNMSVSELERRAGLKQSTIQNILHDRSKNPSIETIRLIAQELNCSIEDLIGEFDSLSSNIATTEPMIPGEGNDWNAILFIKSVESIQRVLDKKNVKLPKKQVLTCVEEVYNYSMGISEEIDQRFAEWIIEKIVRR